MAILTMPSAVDCPGGFGSNPLGDAVTGLDVGNCEEKSPHKQRFYTETSAEMAALTPSLALGVGLPFPSQNGRLRSQVMRSQLV